MIRPNNKSIQSPILLPTWKKIVYDKTSLQRVIHNKAFPVGWLTFEDINVLVAFLVDAEGCDRQL